MYATGLKSVSAASTNDVWTVGTSQPPNGNQQAFAMHWDGTAWSAVPVPNPSTYTYLEDVSVRSADDGWAVGRHDDLLFSIHWDGISWTEIATTEPPPDMDTVLSDSLTAVTINSTHVLSAGVRFGIDDGHIVIETLMESWEGSTWELEGAENTATSSSAIGISADESEDAWAVGYSATGGEHLTPLILRRSGTQWLQDAPPSNTVQADDALNAVFAVEGGEAWAVGSRSDPTHTKVWVMVLHCSIDSDNDGVLTVDDNCPEASNADQADSDSDGVGNACDSCGDDASNDADKDLICAGHLFASPMTGGDDNCPAWPNATQSLPTWPIPPDDSECDGFRDNVAGTNSAPESYLGTIPERRCASTSTLNDEPDPDAWPVDFNDNRIVNGQDVAKFQPAYNHTVAGGPYGGLPGARFDFSGNGIINGQDIAKFAPFYNKTCA
jgi:hypothetical protein